MVSIEFLCSLAAHLGIIIPENTPCHAILEQLDHVVCIGFRGIESKNSSTVIESRLPYIPDQSSGPGGLDDLQLQSHDF